MDRREFLKRMFAAGLVVAAPKFIFDIGANSFKEPDFPCQWTWPAIEPGFEHWKPIDSDPFRMSGYHFTGITFGIETEDSGSIKQILLNRPNA